METRVYLARASNQSSRQDMSNKSGQYIKVEQGREQSTAFTDEEREEEKTEMRKAQLLVTSQ